MALDDADSIKLFISRMNSTTLTSPPTTTTTTLHDQVANGHIDTAHTDNVIDDTKHITENQYNQSEGAKTPPRPKLAVQNHLTSPEPHPKPSPHISGLKAPQNTPKTAASSPRLAAANTHDEDVAEALSDYVNNMDGRPLSDSIWAPGSARHKSSVLSGNRSTRVLTPIKAVDHNPSINDTFDRMSFKAADPDDKVENLIGDHVTQFLFSKAPPLFFNKFAVLPDQVHGDKANDVHAKTEAASDEDLGPSAHTDTTKKVQSEIDGASKDNFETAYTDTVEEFSAKADSASGEDLPNSAQTDRIKKENDVPSASKAYVPPHLRGSSQKPDSGTQPAAQELEQVVDKNVPAAIESSSSKSSQTPSSSDRKPASSEFTGKTVTGPPRYEGTYPNLTSKNAGPVKNANSDFIATLIGHLQERGPLAPEHLVVLKSVEYQLRVRESSAHDKDGQAVTGVEPEPERRFFESNPLQLARQMSYDSKKRAPSALPYLKASLPRVSENEIRVATNGAEPKVTTGPAGGKTLKGAPSEGEDLEHKTIFEAWPKVEERSRPGMFRQIFPFQCLLTTNSRQSSQGSYQRPSPRLNKHLRSFARVRWTH